MAPDLHRNVEADQVRHPGRPGAGDVDDDRRGERPAGRLHARHGSGRDRDRGHLGPLEELRPAVTRRPQEARGHCSRVRVAGSGLVRGHLRIVERERRAEPPDLVGLDDRRLDAQRTLHRDVRPKQVGRAGGHQPEEAGPGEPAVAADPLRPVAEPRERRPRQGRFGGQVVVHPDEAARAPRRSGRDRGPLDDDDPDLPAGQVVGEAGALDARSDDDDVRRLDHVAPPVRTSVGDPPASAYASGSKRAWKKRRYFGS